MEKYLLTWDEVYSFNSMLCGGKAWNLAKLYHFGFTIPKGGAISTILYKQIIGTKYIKELIQQLKTIPNKNLQDDTTKKLIDSIQSAILSSTINQEVVDEVMAFLQEQGIADNALAIRSSATLEDSNKASFAGIHKSYLNIKKSDIAKYILMCFSSFWSLEAISYRRKMQIDEHAFYGAVIIMELVDAKASGVGFSYDSIKGREDITLINANYGLGESIVNGASEPDKYKVDSYSIQAMNITLGKKAKITQKDINCGTKLIDNKNMAQVLNKQQIQTLTKLIRRIYWCFDEIAQDIEWAFDGKEFVILQSRPITVSNQLKLKIFETQKEVFSNANFKDAIPMVQNSLGKSILQHNINTILKIPFDSIGYHIPKGLNLVKIYKGRSYINISALQWLYYDSTGYLPSQTNKTMGGHQDEIEIPKHLKGGVFKKLQRLKNTILMVQQQNRYKKLAQKKQEQLTRFCKGILHIDLARIEDRELLKRIHQCDTEIQNYSTHFAFLSSTSGVLVFLSELLEKYIPNEGEKLSSILLKAEGNITSANHGYELQNLSLLIQEDSEAYHFFTKEPFIPKEWKNLSKASRFKKAFEEFIHKYGHRAVYEGDFANPRWREDSTYLLNMVKIYFENKINLKNMDRYKEQKEKAWKKIKQHLPFYLQGFVKTLIAQSIKGAEFREMGKSNFIRLIEPMRYLFLEAGIRFVQRGILEKKEDIFECAFIEIVSILDGSYSGKNLKELVFSREQHNKQLEKLPAPDFIKEEVTYFCKPHIQKGGNSLKGMAGSSGYVEGIARVILHPNKVKKLTQKDILVAPSTDPAWTPLFLNVAGIVVESGGQLSHGAIVAREYGLPAVINLQGALKVIADGDTIAVDGDKGEVLILNKGVYDE